MAKLTTPITLGIDVAKDTLAIYHWNEDRLETIDNDPGAIKTYLDGLHGPVQLALEPSSDYYFAMADVALARGLAVYLVNARQLAHYRHAVDLRHKSDPHDAWLLARYLCHEAEQLRPLQLRDRRARRLWGLITRRGTIVQARQRLKQSMAGTDFSIKALLTQFQSVLARLEHQIQSLIRQLGWWGDYRHCLSIPGVGPANAAALVAAYHRGTFSSSDTFVAYLGLDIRLRGSGCFKGKSKLTKHGEPELRRLLYCAARPALCYPRFAQYHLRMLDKGHSKTAARVALARKLARIAFTLINRDEDFRETS